MIDHTRLGGAPCQAIYFAAKFADEQVSSRMVPSAANIDSWVVAWVQGLRLRSGCRATVLRRNTSPARLVARLTLILLQRLNLPRGYHII